MKSLRLLFTGCLVLLGLISAAAQAPVAAGTSAAEIKRVTDRYALTKARISALLDLRLNPAPLPVNPPNPFYQPPAEVLSEQNAALQQDPNEVVPEAADLSDIDTLRKYAAALKVSGLITLNGVPHLTINNTTSKVGDIITVGTKDRPVYLKLLALSPAEFTLGLNDTTLAVSLRKP
jgi:hypothetical protein